MQGVAQINTAQNRINKRLQQGNENFKDNDAAVERQRDNAADTERDNKAGDDFQHNVADGHVGDKTDGQAERFGKERYHFNRDNQGCQSGRNSFGQKGAEIAPFLFPDTDADVEQQRDDGQSADGGQMRRKGKGVGEQAEQVAESDKQKNRKDKRKVFQPFNADVFFQQRGDKFVNGFRYRLGDRGNDGSFAQAEAENKSGNDNRQNHKQAGVGKRDVHAADFDGNNRLNRKLFHWVRHD